MDIKDIIEAICDECSGPIKKAYTLIDQDPIFCCYECAEQAVNNYNADYAERKADDRKYEGP